MYLGKVIGSVVATNKDATMKGRKLLLVRPLLIDGSDPSQFKEGSNTIVAVDSVGAGGNEIVMFAQGSSARMADGMKACPVDAAIIGIVDQVSVLNQQIYSSKD